MATPESPLTGQPHPGSTSDTSTSSSSTPGSSTSGSGAPGSGALRPRRRSGSAFHSARPPRRGPGWGASLLSRSARRAVRRQDEQEARRRRRLPTSLTRAMAAQRPGPRGWTGPGAGQMRYVEAPAEWRGTSVQVCGMWPFPVGGDNVAFGVPLGPHLFTSATVCADPVQWFLRRLISTPSAFVLGRPGLGKSTLVRRMVAVMAGWGYLPLILSDLKPDYVDLGEAIGAQIIRLGRGIGSINLLDLGPLKDRLPQLPEPLRTQAMESLRGRRQESVIGVLTLIMDRALTSREASVVATALRVLDDEHDEATRGIPLIGDVLALVRARHPRLRAVALDRGDTGRYDDLIEDLEAALQTLADPQGRFGDVFCKPTSEPMLMDRPVVFDVSSIDLGDAAMRAAAQLACWSYGSAAVSAAKFLAEAQLAPERVYVLVMDELWQILRACEELVHIIDALLRLNRQLHLATILITHTMADLKLKNPHLSAMARGFVERSSMLFLGGLSNREFADLGEVFEFSREERRLIASWSNNSDSGGAPPGQGKFLLKLGSAPGTPFTVKLTSAEMAVNDTNRRWAAAARRARSTAPSGALSKPARVPAAPLVPPDAAGWLQ